MKKESMEALRVCRTSLLAIVWLLCCAVASAQSFTVDGIRYYITAYDDDSRTVEVTYAETNYEGVISIPESVVFDNVEFVVTNIGYDAFWYSNVTSVVLPNTIEHISNYAFYGCENLLSVTLGNSLKSIGDYAFYNCHKLSSITLPESLTYIGDDAFQYCSKLVNVKFPSSLTSIGYDAFADCSSLVDIVIPEAVSYIGSYAFSGCSSLTSVTISGTVTDIGNGIFYGCSALEEFKGKYASEDGRCLIVDGSLLFFASTGLTEYKIPASVTSIGSSAFAECDSLRSITMPENLTSIGNGAFAGCKLLTNVTIPESVTNIGAEAFAYCFHLGTLIIPNSVTSIEPYTFFCSGLTDVTIPESITSIGDCAFGGSLLTAITIPESVTSMGDNVFADCPYLTEFKGNFVSEDGVCLIVDSVLKVFIAKDVAEYVIPKGVKSIGSSVFANCSNLKSVTFSNSVINLGEQAFSGCSALTNVDLGDSLKTIGSYAFSGCDALVSIAIPESVTSIGSGVFYSCDALNSVVLPNSLSTLSYEMFYGCRNLTSVSLPDSLKTIEARVFYNCDGLADILIPSSVKTIGSNTFYDCDGLTSVDLPDSLINLSSYMFNGCDNLVSVSLSDSLKSIGSYAFRRCSVLSSVTLPETLEKIDDGAFSYCGKLESVVVPNSVTYLGRETFYACESLSNVTLPNSLTSIYSSTFSGCSSLVDVALPSSLTTLGDYAFEYCSELTSITIPETVTTFGTNVFYGCSNLKEFKGVNASDDGRCLIINGILKSFLSAGLTEYTLPNIVRGIGERVFAGCSNLTNIVLGDSVNCIENSAFSECSELVNFALPKTVQSIGSYAFSNCSNLTSLIVPDSVTYIGEYAFHGCSSLSSISLGNSLEGISPGMFYGCYNLHDVAIPNSVKYIGESAFAGCYGLSNFSGAFASEDGKCLIVEKKIIAFAPVGLSEYVIPDSVTNIGYGVFSGCSNLLNIAIPENVINIGNYAFSNCNGLTKVSFPNTILSIGEKAFYGCDGLSSIVIPNSITCINYGAFQYCSNLTSITIPNSVASINSYAFYNCNNVTQIDCQALEPPTCSYGVFSGIDKTVCMLTVPVGSKEAYQNASYWNEFQQIVEEGTVLPKYLLTYIIDGEVYATDSITCGAVITPKAAPTKNGYIFSGWSEIPRIMPAEDFVVTGTFEISKEYQAACTQLEALVTECDSLFAVNPVANLTQVLTEAKVFMANIQNASLTEINQVYKNLKKVRDGVVMMDVLVTRSDVELTVTNDPTYPWALDEVNQCITNGNKGVKYSISTASISYKSDYKTELKLDWASNNYSRHPALQLYVDGELKASTSNSSYTTPRLIIAAGEHVIAIRDSIGNSTSAYNWSRVKNLILREMCLSADSLLTAKSERITFENNDDYPWTWEDGYAQNTNRWYSNTTSELTSTFTVEKPSKFSFDVYIGESYDYHHGFDFKINEETYYSYSSNNSWYTSSTGWMKKAVLLEPGKYTIAYLDSISNAESRKESRLRNVELHSDWLEIDLASAGTLGAEALYQVDVLGDVELLRVKGTLNAEDWAIIKQMKNLIGLDLTEARFDAVPDYGFDGLSYLSSVKLPEGMTAIGQYAFRGTQIWKIQIPATVTSIGQYAFASTRLEEITFPENSQLTTIGNSAFYSCTSLKEFIMPNTVTTLGLKSYSSDACTFYQCPSLKKLHFSDALTSIPNYTCYECYRLSDIHWPKGLVSIGYQAFRDVDDLCSLEFPETLTSIGYECFWSNNSLTHVKLPAKLTSLGDNAFIHCDALKCIEFPSYIGRYYYTLQYCTALDTIVCHAPTPPAVAGDILSGGRAKSNVTLIVPAFSAVSYKLDSYWYQYGNIVASEEVQDYWRVAGDLALTNNRRMGGKPDIDLYYNGRLLVGGDAAFEAGTMNFFINESQPCRLLNNCPTVNVDSVNTYYSVNKDTWYFFTPLYDVKVSDVIMSNDASYVFRYYDGAVRASAGTGSSWTDVPKDSVLLAGQGYIFRCNKACVVNIPADASVHAQLFDFAAKSIPLTAHESETEANRNWNYVGNPYPSYYDIWYMNSSAPITVWNESKKTYDAYSVTDDDFVLRPMQSFFVQKPDGEESILFRPEGRQLTNTVAHASYATRSGEPRFVFNLEIGTDSVADRTRVVFNAVKSMDYELECDASKFMSMDATVPQIYSLDAKGNRLAINERPKADGRVALGVYIGKAGEYTLSASRMDGTVKLYDAPTDSYTDLAETSYTFRADEAGFIEGRFELTLEVRGGATGIDEAEADEVKVSVKNGIISVSGAEGTAVQLYSIDGKLLQSQTISSGNALFDAPADGVYVVTANGVSQKAVVQEGRR